jgi:hypothetical protein
MATQIPSMEELEQMSTEELEALANQMVPGAMPEGMPEGMPEEGAALPPMDVAEPSPEDVAEVAEVAEDVGSPLTEAEAALNEILLTTQDSKEILDLLRNQGFEVRRSPGVAQAEVEQMEDDIEAAPAGGEVESTASVSEPVNLRDLTKKATANAMKGA